MNVLDDARDRLVFVHDSRGAERPDRPAGQRRQKDSARCVTQRLPVASFEGLDDQLRPAPVLGGLGDLDTLGQHPAA